MFMFTIMIICCYCWLFILIIVCVCCLVWQNRIEEHPTRRIILFFKKQKITQIHLSLSLMGMIIFLCLLESCFRFYFWIDHIQEIVRIRFNKNNLK